MPATYSYDPDKLEENGVDRLRFELQDTAVAGGSQTCAMCDGEYQFILNQASANNRNWKWIIIECLEKIVKRMAYESTYSGGGISVQLSERYPRWEKMLREMKASRQAPIAKLPANNSTYFRLGMHDNR